MSLKKVLLEKVPSNLQEEAHFHALLDQIKHYNIEDKVELQDFLQKEINTVGNWVEENKNSSNIKVKSVREKIIHLDLLNKCSELTEEFLF